MKSAVILHVPHAGLEVPDGLQPLPSITDLPQEIRLMADFGTDYLAEQVVAAVNRQRAALPTIFANPISRAFLVNMVRYLSLIFTHMPPKRYHMS